MSLRRESHLPHNTRSDIYHSSVPRTNEHYLHKKIKKSNVQANNIPKILLKLLLLNGMPVAVKQQCAPFVNGAHLRHVSAHHGACCVYTIHRRRLYGIRP